MLTQNGQPCPPTDGGQGWPPTEEQTAATWSLPMGAVGDRPFPITSFDYRVGYADAGPYTLRP